MRVTSIMKDYIREEVTKRIAPKYEEKSKIKKSRDNIKHDFITRLTEELNNQMNKSIDNFLLTHQDYEDNRSHTWGNTVTLNYSIISNKKDDIENWRKDMEQEITAKVKEIVVTLELGGTKKDLDELLNNI